MYVGFECPSEVRNTLTMIEKKFSLQLDGQTTLSQYVVALNAWRESLEGATKLTGSAHVLGEYVSDLSSGSTITETTITFDRAEAADTFEEYMDRTHVAVRDGSIRDLPLELQKGAYRLQRISAMPGSPSMVLRSGIQDVLVSDQNAQDARRRMKAIPQVPAETYGELIGRLQALSSRTAFTGTLYDSTFDKAVRCYFEAGQEEMVRDQWDRRVAITGMIRRDPATGRPLSIRRISNVVAAPRDADAYSWTSARGILVGVLPNELPETLLGRLRDE